MEMLSLRSAVHEAMMGGKDPRDIISYRLHRDIDELKGDFNGSDEELWQLLLQIAANADRERTITPKVPITDLAKAIDLIRNAERIVIIIGAGASVGPDFRSPGGLYDTIEQSGTLNDPYDVFSLNYFAQDPSIFWRFAHLIFPSITPEHSAVHYFIQYLEQSGKLLRLYSQNVDTLEIGVPDDKLRCVHGSWRNNQCMNCDHPYSIEDIRPAVNARVVPHCVRCGGPIKPGIVFFGQPTNLDENEAYEDADNADLLIVIGTSLQVAPISELPVLMHHVPSILINRVPVNVDFNCELLGECDTIIHTIESELGLSVDDYTGEPAKFYGPNKFVFESETGFGSSVVETGQSQFLVTPCAVDENDFLF